MSQEHTQKIIEWHQKEVDDEYVRKSGDDLVYDKITWDNIEPFLPLEGLILDAGGGAGIWSLKMAEKRRRMVVLLDITLDLLEVAKQKIYNEQTPGHIEVLNADIRALPHPESSFDFILCEADPICICGNPEKAISEFSRVIKNKGYLIAGIDSTFYRVFHALSQGKSLDSILDFLQTGIAPPEDDAGVDVVTAGFPFESKSFTPREFIILLKKYHLETVKIVGKPLGFRQGILDSFVSVIPTEKRHRIFKDLKEKRKLAQILHLIYEDPYIAGIGSHLQVVAKKTN